MTHLMIEPAVLLPPCAGRRAGFVSISVTGKQKRRKRRQRSADGQYERMWRRSPWEPLNSQDDAGRESSRLPLAQSEKKYGIWNNLLTVELFIRLYIDGRWHWIAYSGSRASALAVHSIRFHFAVPELVTHSSEESSCQHWMYPLTWYSAFSFFAFPLVHPETLVVIHQVNKIEISFPLLFRYGELIVSAKEDHGGIKVYIFFLFKRDLYYSACMGDYPDVDINIILSKVSDIFWDTLCRSQLRLDLWHFTHLSSVTCIYDV